MVYIVILSPREHGNDFDGVPVPLTDRRYIQHAAHFPKVHITYHALLVERVTLHELLNGLQARGPVHDHRPSELWSCHERELHVFLGYGTAVY